MSLLLSLSLWRLLGGCAPDAGERPVLRLTPAEYNHTVRDLLGLSPEDWYDASMDFEADDFVAPWPFAFAPELAVDGFDGMAPGQVPSPVYVEQIERAALHFAPYVHRSPRFWVCEERDCAEDSVVLLARRAWRRPLLREEEQRLRDAFRGWEAEHGEQVAISLAVAALLQTPAFLYRIEGMARSGHSRSYEMASHLSYFLWDSMPDTALFQAAERGHLESADEVRAAGRYLLDNPRAREMVARFHRQLLQLDGLQTQRVDFGTYGERYAPQLVGMDPFAAMEFWSGVLNGTRQALLEEVDLFVTTTVFDEEGTLQALLTSDRGWIGAVNEGWEVPSNTAAIYGDSAPTEGPIQRTEHFDGNFGYAIEMRPVLHRADQRAGLLTLGATLAARTHPIDPASIQRGVFVLERLLCQTLGAPPPGATLAPPPALPKDATNREQLEARTASPACAGCHEAINPIGFAFEAYDPLGGWRETDRGQPVDTSGVLRVPGEPDRPFEDAVELAAALARSDRVHDCYTTHWARQALGDPEIALDDPRFSEVRARFRASSDIRGLLLDLVSSDAFRRRGGR